MAYLLLGIKIMNEIQIEGHRLILSDNMKAMPNLEDNSIDLVATDPPYGIGFMGKHWDKALPNPATWKECYRVLKPGGSAVVMSGARLDCLWRMCRDLEDAGFELQQTALYWVYVNGFPKGDDFSIKADIRAGVDREIVGARHSGYTAASEGYCRPNASMYTHKSYNYTVPSSPLANSLNGWFSKGKVKPAVEVIIWARKPISEATELDNMARWNVGGVNCGACMIPFADDEDGYFYPNGQGGISGYHIHSKVFRHDIPKANDPRGRFPANLLVTDTAMGPDTSKYFDVTRWASKRGYSEDWVMSAEAGLLEINKPTRREKEAGCEHLEQKVNPISNPDDNRTFQHSNNKKDTLVKNNHPTCKPISLFSYLIEFLTMPGATVLDPFMGSGTTVCACVQSGRFGIGIDIEEDFFNIACGRVAHVAVAPKPQVIKTEYQPVQPSLEF